MSDIEEYYDEFDDDEIFWVEEADPTEADDLAAAATHDPMLPEDPSLETADFFSDWEDLSDDYYDEDPTAVRRLRAMGLLPIKEQPYLDALTTKRRKVADTLPTDMTSFQGVAWKHPEDETDIVEIYAPGEGEKVSLLKNWREIFRNAKPAIGPLRGRIPPSRSAEAVSREQSESDLDVPSLMEDICEDEVISSDAAEPQPVKPVVTTPLQAVVNSPSKLPAHPKKGDPGHLIDTLESINEVEEPSTTNGVATKPPVMQKTKEPPAAEPQRGRKRKASASVDDKPDASENTAAADAQPKAKRAATAKTTQTTNPASSGPVRRSARRK
ncbi:uncharacterized protein BDV17DRAFT_271308 [Aspergillus undulatus]|uniref:uncharacterized protein n=1 Tax=Aspergillus undulatus TaxID=1810928 RepID=UPI003CCDCACF